MGYHVIGNELVEISWVDKGATVVLEDSTDTLELGGDIQLKPTATSTAHIETTGSLRVRATDNMHIGDDLVDSIRIGRDNTTAAKVHIRSGADTDLVVSDGKVGIGMDDPSHSLEIDGDIQLSPTAISTAHISSAGSLKIDADSNMEIGHTLVDSVRVGRVNTGLVKVHVRSGADTDLVVSDSKVGIGTDTPTQALDVVGDVKLSGDLTVGGQDIKASDGTTCMTLNDSTGQVYFANSIRLAEDNYIGTPNDTVLVKLDGTLDRVDITGGIKTTGGQIVAVRSLTDSDSTYAVVAGDYVLSCDTSSGVLAITLPAASTIGRTLHIVDAAGAADSNAITINVESSGSETIQGDTSLALSTEYAAATLVCVAANKWSIL